jgi:AP-3 complex subunit beta
MSKVISPLIKFLRLVLYLIFHFLMIFNFFRASREVQYCILDYIHTLAIEDPRLFQPHILEFFVFSPSEPSFIKLQKLTILSLIASEINIDIILKEFKFYTLQDDEEFVANTIHAIGSCAIRIPEVKNY